MSKNLVIVESPAKAKTIERYLGPEYTVLASYGHVRDLPENPGRDQLGVDIDNDFAPQYEIVADRRRQVGAISRAAKGAEAVYLATDLDREGEAIAWHVAEAAGLPADRTRRVTFSEITERAIREAFAHPRQVDHRLVDAQQARRVVDRLVGYTLSPLLWRKVRGGLSAGRVQSVAVRLVVEREREIRGFKAREYWSIEAELAAPGGAIFRASLTKIDGRKAEIANVAAAEGHVAALRTASPTVGAVGVKRLQRQPAAPFTTSTLQQEASRKLGLSPKRTMAIAQKLYEGLPTAEGQIGLITYMRTDSTTMSGGAMGEARAVIGGRFGPRYVVARGRVHRTKVRNAQEAHEAIRPTSFGRDPETLGRSLGRDEGRLYRLIWQRALASQMAARELETTTVDLIDEPYELRASATKTIFDGFAAVYTEGRDDGAEESEASLPALAEGDRTAVVSVTPTQHFTEPPARYTEASLIKALEEHGIGRPSTYASTIATIVDRGYVRVADRRLVPDLVGEIVTDLLVDHFGEFVDVQFTARMEGELDDVARGKRAWVPVVRQFYTPFRSLVAAKSAELRRSDFTTQPSEEVCSEGHPMVIRLGRFGRFLACSQFPAHRETRPLPAEEESDQPATIGPTGSPEIAGAGEPCPECGSEHGGLLVAKRGRFGPFAGCSRYPECRYVRRTGPAVPSQLPFTVTCPRCSAGHLVARRARRSGSVFWGCSSYPACRFTTSRQPTGSLHEGDGGPLARGARGEIACLSCGAVIQPAEPGETVGERTAATGAEKPRRATRARPYRRPKAAIAARSGDGERRPDGEGRPDGSGRARRAARRRREA